MAPKLPNLAGQSEEPTETPDTVKTRSKNDIVEIKIDLGESTNVMRINGHEFYHGMTYKVPAHMVPSMNEIMANTRAHDEVVKGNATVVGGMSKRYRGNAR